MMKFIVWQDPVSHLWKWRLRSGANDRDWALSGEPGYTRQARAVGACKLLHSKLAGSAQCPHIQINKSDSMWDTMMNTKTA